MPIHTCLNRVNVCWVKVGCKKNKNTMLAVMRVDDTQSFLNSRPRYLVLMRYHTPINELANRVNKAGIKANSSVFKKNSVTVLPESLAKQSTDTILLPIAATARCTTWGVMIYCRGIG
jgi:hypothetical protein